MYEPDETEKIPDDYLRQLRDDDALRELDVHATIQRDEDIEGIQIRSLPMVPVRPISGVQGMFELSSKRLGAGGVGEVRLATQPALRRDVAVKVARREKHGSPVMAAPQRMLLREALVMGYLEHPNIVPIHVLGRDERGELVVAMKLVEGESLLRILNAGEHSQDQLFDILIGVCNALDYAHQRGIVHLDIKPANVMVGPYGDTYLVDWGAAVAYRKDVPDTIPRPLNDKKVRGTPAYLAPEMAIAAPTDPRTDVYLVGGLLHCILTRRPPNPGKTPTDALKFAYLSPPREFPDDVPPELAAITNRALSRLADERYQTVAEFREALETYRSSVAARDVHASANRRMLQLEEMTETNAEPADVYALFGSARQLLKDAARLYADDARTAGDEQRLVTRMVEWELGEGDPKAALRLVHELPHDSPELLARVETAVAEKEAELAELDNLRRQIDPTVANMSKVVMFAAIGTIIATIHILPYVFDLGSSPTQVMGGHIIYLVALLGISVALRGRLLATYANRLVVYLIWLLSLFGLILRLGATLGTFSLGHAIGLDLALVGLTSIFGALAIDKRLWAAPVWYAAGTLACFIWPAYGTAVFGASHFFGLVSVAVAFAVTGAKGQTHGE